MKPSKFFVVLFVFLFALVSVPFASADLTDGVISYYKLDEISGTTAVDSAGSNDGTANNLRVFTSEVAGIINTGADFTQGNDYINLPNSLVNTGLKGSGAVSFSTWVYFDSTSSDRTIFYAQTTNNNAGLELLSIGGQLRIGGRSQLSDSFQSRTGSTLSTGEWYHIVAIWDFENSEVILYLDGVEDIKSGVSFGSSTLNYDVNNIDIGKLASTRYFDGKIDEVGFYNRALIQSQVTQLYDAQKDGFESGQYPTFGAAGFPLELEDITFSPNVSVFTTTSFKGVGSLNESNSDARVNYQIIRERSSTNTTLTDSFTTTFTNGGLDWETVSVATSSTQQGDLFYLVAEVVNATNTSQSLSASVTSSPITIENRDPVINNLFFDRGSIAVSAQDIKGFINVNDLDGDNLDVSWELRRGSTSDFGAGTLVDSDTINNIAKNSDVELFTLLSSETEVGDFFRIDATVTDPFTGETSDSSVELEVISSLADVTFIDFNPSSPNTLQNIVTTVITNSDNGGDIRISYTITRNGNAFDSGVVTSYTEDNGDYLFVLPTINSASTTQEDVFVVVADPQDLNGAVIGGGDTDSVTIINRIPTISSSRFDPTVLFDNVNFRIFVTPNDLDGDNLNITWRVERTRSASTTTIASGTQTGVTGSPGSYSEVELAVISNSLLELDDQIRFFATADDGFDTSTEFQSSLLTVQQVTDTIFQVADIFSSDPINNYDLLFNPMNIIDDFEGNLSLWDLGTNAVSFSSVWSSQGSSSALFSSIGSYLISEFNLTGVDKIFIDYNLVTEFSEFNSILINDVRQETFEEGIGVLEVDVSTFTGLNTISIGEVVFCQGPCPGQEFYIDNVRFVLEDDFNFSSDINGQVVLEENDLADGLYLLNILNATDREGYFNKTLELDYSYPMFRTFELTQATAEFTATELGTNQELTDFNFTILGETYNSSETIPISAGSYNATLSKSGYFNLTKQITVQSLTSNTFVFQNVYNSVLNITAKDIFTDEFINNFTINVSKINTNFSSTQSTITGNLLVPVLNNTSFNITIFSNEIAPQTRQVLINQTIQPYEFEVFSIRSIFFRFLDATTNQLIDDRLININLINDLQGYNYNTTDGTVYATLLQPLTYLTRSTAENYVIHYSEVTIMEDTGEIITFYMLPDNNTEEIMIRIIDEFTNNVFNAKVTALRYNSVNNNYLPIGSSRTDTDGRVYFNLIPNEEFYKFIVQVDGQIVLTSTPRVIRINDIIDGITLQISTGPDLTEAFRTIRNINTALVYNYDTENFRLDFSNALGSDITMCLLIERPRILENNVFISEECLTSSSGTILIPYSLEDFTVRARAVSQGQVYNELTIYVPRDVSFGVLGLFIQLILTLSFIGFTMSRPKLLLLSISFSLMIGKFFNFHDLSWTSVFVSFVVSIIISYTLRDR